MYTIAIETDHAWDTVDAGHCFATALADRGATGTYALRWRTLREAREAADWLARKYTADEARAIVVLRDDHNGEASHTAPVTMLPREIHPLPEADPHGLWADPDEASNG